MAADQAADKGKRKFTTYVPSDEEFHALANSVMKVQEPPRIFAVHNDSSDAFAHVLVVSFVFKKLKIRQIFMMSCV